MEEIKKKKHYQYDKINTEDFLKNMAELGKTFFANARNHFEQLVNELEERGRAEFGDTDEKMQHFTQEAERMRANFEERANNLRQQFMDNWNMVSHNEIEELKTRLSDLEQKIKNKNT